MVERRKRRLGEQLTVARDSVMQLTQEVVDRLISSKILTRRVSVKLSGVGLGKSASRLRRPDADIRRDVLNAWP